MYARRLIGILFAVLFLISLGLIGLSYGPDKAVIAQQDDSCSTLLPRALEYLADAQVALSQNDITTALQRVIDVYVILIQCNTVDTIVTPITDSVLLYPTITAQAQQIQALQQTIDAFTANGNAPVPTLDPNLIPNPRTPNPSGLNPSGCVTYVVREGDTCGGIAVQFGVELNEFIAFNNLNFDCTDLQVGQTVQIPGFVCPTPFPSSNSVLPSLTPTIISIPQINLQIIDVLSVGDLANEVVIIENRGQAIDLSGWTLADAVGNTYLFPPFRLTTGGVVRLYTRSGQNTPDGLFWNKSQAMWQNSSIISLFTPDDTLHSVYVLGDRP